MMRPPNDFPVVYLRREAIDFRKGISRPLAFGNVNPRPSLDLLLSSFFVSSAPWSETGWNNEKVDRLVLAARGEGDEARRKQMYVDIQTIIHEECPIGIRLHAALVERRYVRAIHG